MSAPSYACGRGRRLCRDKDPRATREDADGPDALVPTLTSLGISQNVATLYREMTEALGKGIVRFDGKGRAVRGKTTLEDVLRRGLGTA